MLAFKIKEADEAPWKFYTPNPDPNVNDISVHAQQLFAK